MKPLRQCRRWRDCPLCQNGESGILNHTMELNRRYFELREKEHEGMALKKPEGVTGANGAPTAARSGDEWVLYPTLMEYLAEGRYEDGAPRRTSTVTLFVEEGRWKACVNDRDNDRSAFVSAESLTALLVIIEDKLSKSSVDWKPNGGSSKRRR